MKDHLKQIQQDVDEMNKGLGGELKDNVIEELSTDLPSTDVPGTESPSTDAPGTDSPSTEAPATDAPTTEAPEDVLDEKDKVIEDLRKQLDEKSKPKTEAPTTEAPISFEEEDFLGEVDFDELKEDPEKFNKFLNDFRRKIILESRKVLGEGVLRSIPEIIRTNIKLHSEMQKSSEKFYSENEDLKPFKRVVAAVFEEVSADNPDKTYDEILKDIGPEVRKRLNLQKQAKTKSDDNNLPRLPKKTKGKAPKDDPKPKTAGIEAEISEMNKHIGR